VCDVTKIKVSDYIINRIAQENIKHIFGLSGGMAMHLVQSAI
jgi:TPP-dependent 2-oxoacid decarboxylase